MKILSIDQINSYKKDGFILLPGLLSNDEVTELSDEYNELFERKKQENSRMEAKWSGDWNEKSENSSSNTSVLSIHNLQLHSAAFSRLLLNKKLTDALKDLMDNCVGNVEDEKSVVLHHTKAHLKPSNEGAAFPTHQDYHYFPYKQHSMMAVFVHLDDTDQSNGGLGVFPGSHLQGPQDDVSTSSSHHYLDQNIWSLDNATPLKAAAGDVLIFSYLLVHGSYINASDRERRMFLIQVAAGEDESASDKHRSPCAGMVLSGKNKKQEADLSKRHEK